MEVEFRKDLRHNYMVVIEDQYFNVEAYCIKMLEQMPEGILPLELRYLDNRTLFYYDITAKQSMNNLLEKVSLSYDKIYHFISKLTSTIEMAYEHLLPEDDFILSPEFIYLDINTCTPSLCFLSGYRKELKEQLQHLFEYLMNKVDYHDKEAVLLIYQLYASSREEGFTFERLTQVVQKQSSKELELGNHHKKQQRDQGDKSRVQKTEVFPEERQVKKSQLTDNLVNINTKKKENKGFNRNSILKDKWMKCNIIKSRNLSAGQKTPTLSTKQNKKEIKAEQIKIDKKNPSGVEIPVMMERIEDETEIYYYPVRTYLYTVGCIFAGIGIIVFGLMYNVFYNTFGDRIDYSKVFAFVLILLSCESYIMKVIWNKKNRLTKINKKCEYINPLHDVDDRNNGLRINKKFNVKESSKWQQDPETAQREEAEVVTKPAQSKDSTSYDDRPTCLLNEKEVGLKIILKPVDEINYQTITLRNFPFFVGKLQRNVDFCLEKDVVSRFHAKITIEADQYFITDLNSTNGTFVNQEAVPTYQKREIRFGDEIAFANIRYLFLQDSTLKKFCDHKII